jgi:hypothetical protein
MLLEEGEARGLPQSSRPRFFINTARGILLTALKI